MTTNPRSAPLGVDPAVYVAAGATWCMTEFEPEEMTLDQVRGVLRDGPAIQNPEGAAAR